MLYKGKLVVFFGSAVIVLYAVSAAFYGRVVARDDAYKKIAIFMEAIKRIDDDYVEAPDMNKVQEAAMRGLIEALDPYCSFISKEQLAAIEKRNASGTAGVGLVLSKRADVVYVVSLQREGGAEEVGLRPGDYLVDVDGISLEDKSIKEAQSLFRGAPGSKVKVTVFRGGRPKPLEFELTRKTDAPVPVVSQMLDANVGVLDVSSLGDSTVEQARVKLKTLISAGAQKLILDLRDCADGEPVDGAELANFFLREGLIYYSKNRQGERVLQVEASPARFITDLPMVVLINGSTSGPAEIAAGALKDHKRATLVGEKSFGAGASQRQIVLKSGSIITLSTAKFYTPGGKMIQDELIRNTGIKPDVESPDDDHRQELLVESYYDDKEDVVKYRELRDRIYKEQLQKAMELLAGIAAQTKRAA